MTRRDHHLFDESTHEAIDDATDLLVRPMLEALLADTPGSTEVIVTMYDDARAGIVLFRDTHDRLGLFSWDSHATRTTADPAAVTWARAGALLPLARHAEAALGLTAPEVRVSDDLHAALRELS